MLKLAVLVVVVVLLNQTAHHLAETFQMEIKDRMVVAVDTLVAAVVVG
jgi:hypothetical protein